MAPKSRFRHSLPHAHGTFQNRDELKELFDWLQDPHSNICVLIGAPGSGKSALARHVAQTIEWPERNELIDGPTDIARRPVFGCSFEFVTDPFRRLLRWWRGGDVEPVVNAQDVIDLLEDIDDAGTDILIILDALDHAGHGDPLPGVARDTLDQISDPLTQQVLIEAARQPFDHVKWLLTTRYTPTHIRRAARTSDEVDVDEPISGEDYFSLDSKRYRSIYVNRLPMSACEAIMSEQKLVGDRKDLAARCGQHALMLTLASRFVRYRFEGNIDKADHLLPTELDWQQLQHDRSDFAGSYLELVEWHRAFLEGVRTDLESSDPIALALLERLCLYHLPVNAQITINSPEHEKNPLAEKFSEGDRAGWVKEEKFVHPDHDMRGVLTAPDILAGDPGLEGADIGELDRALTKLINLHLVEVASHTMHRAHALIRHAFSAGIPSERKRWAHMNLVKQYQIYFEHFDVTNHKAWNTRTVGHLEEFVYHLVRLNRSDDAYLILTKRTRRNGPGILLADLISLGYLRQEKRMCRSLIDSTDASAHKTTLTFDVPMRIRAFLNVIATRIELGEFSKADHEFTLFEQWAKRNNRCAETEYVTGAATQVLSSFHRGYLKRALKYQQQVDIFQHAVPNDNEMRMQTAVLKSELDIATGKVEAGLRTYLRQFKSDFSRADHFLLAHAMFDDLGRLLEARTRVRLDRLNNNRLSYGQSRIAIIELSLLTRANRFEDARKLLSEIVLINGTSISICRSWIDLERGRLQFHQGLNEAILGNERIAGQLLCDAESSLVESIQISVALGLSLKVCDARVLLARIYFVMKRDFEAEALVGRALYGCDSDNADQNDSTRVLGALDPECGYVWGEIDARFLLGKIYLARAQQQFEETSKSFDRNHSLIKKAREELKRCLDMCQSINRQVDKVDKTFQPVTKEIAKEILGIIAQLNKNEFPDLGPFIDLGKERVPGEDAISRADSAIQIVKRRIRRVPKQETELDVQAYLAKHPDATADEIAANIPGSKGAVVGTDAWKLANAKRQMKRVQNRKELNGEVFEIEIENRSAGEDVSRDDELDKLIDEQRRDADDDR